MRKNFTLLFLLGILGLFTTNLFAQQDATIDPADIRYWIGEGENEVVFIVNWAEPDTALAWGFRFATEAITVEDMMMDIQSADYRFSYNLGPWGIGDILFNDGTLNLGITSGGYWMFNVDGEMAQVGFDQQTVTNGSYVKWGDTNCGTVVDPENWVYVWEKPVEAVYPLADDAKIDPSAIRYWVGEGENEVVFIVNWNEPDTALAWGYRFNEETVTVKDMMDKIADVDNRFSYTLGPWGIGDILFNDGILDLSITAGGYWMFNVDGEMAQVGFDQQIVVNGNYVKWGDTNCGTMIDPNWVYVWEEPVVGVYALAEEAMIDPSEIRYWVGEGENKVVFCVNWAEPNTALAWGYRFDGESVTVKTVMDAIKEADGRFDYVIGAWGVDDITYNYGDLNLGLSEYSYFMYNVNGEYAWYGFDQQTLVNGDFVKFGDIACGSEIAAWTYVWEKEVEAVYPYGVEAKIEFSEILYWVGEGQNEIVFAVNWNEPNRCLAWGYRFDGESVTVKEVMDAIAETDRRFSYVTGDWGVEDIIFNVDADETHYNLAGNYWLYNVNGMMAGYGYDEQTLQSGDFVKWGDESCATEIAEWTYVWTQTVEPVWMNTGVDEIQCTLSVYPNPAVNETFVTLDDAGMTTISVYDVQGRLVSNLCVEAVVGEQVRISTETLNSGMYFVTVSNDSAVRTAKLVVK